MEGEGEGGVKGTRANGAGSLMTQNTGDGHIPSSIMVFFFFYGFENI